MVATKTFQRDYIEGRSIELLWTDKLIKVDRHMSLDPFTKTQLMFYSRGTLELEKVTRKIVR